jgi:hypothetical protein
MLGWAPVVALVLATLTGCSGGGSFPDPAESSPATAAPIRIPADGVPLTSFGFTNGPVREFSLPRTSTLKAVVDQTNNVTMVLTSPTAPEAYAYLQRALPATGFTVTAENAATTTLTFTGYGWQGSFTGNPRAAAVLLRPVS